MDLFRRQLVVAFFVAFALLAGACTSISLVTAPEDTKPSPGPTLPDATECPPLGEGASIDPDQMEIPATAEGTKPTEDAVTHLRCLPAVSPAQKFIPQSDVLPIFDSIEEPEDKELVVKVEPLVKLLGWIPPDASFEETLDRIYGVGTLGFYVPKDNVLYVVAEGDTLSPLSQATLAHEWVHALQQSAFDIEAAQDAVPDFAFDRGGALSALVEGDAAYYEEKFTDEYFSRKKSAESTREELQYAGDDFSDIIPLVVDIIMPYEEGPAFVEAVLDSGGSPPLADIYARPPVTSAEILHPDLYLDGFKPVEVEMPDVPGALGGGWQKTIDGTWGEYSTANFIAGLAETIATRELTVVDGWRGDRLGLWENGPSGVAAIQTAWDDSRTAQDVANRLENVLARNGERQGEFYGFPGDRLYRVTQDGAHTLILMTNDTATLDSLANLEPLAGTPTAA